MKSKKAITEQDTEAQVVTAKVAQKSTVKDRVRAIFSTRKRKIVTIIGLAVLLLAILFAVPFTRYGILGKIIHKNVIITVIDSKTNQPVVDAAVTVGDISVLTNKDGTATLNAVGVGPYSLKIVKKYYEANTRDYSVPIFSQPEHVSSKLNAVGRQLAILVGDTISGQPLKGVTITASDTTAATNEEGQATIVVPASPQKQSAVISLSGYEPKTIALNVDSTVSTKVSLTQSGSVLYLSKATGKINVMRSNLDGTNAKVVLAGTGNEDNTGTLLFAARDWKYGVLLSRRDGENDSLYLIENSSGKVTQIDKGNASFNLAGWSGHNFFYTVTRNTPEQWDKNRQALKVYDAEARAIKTLDQTNGTGSVYPAYSENIDNVYILDNEVVYLKYSAFQWNYEGDAKVDTKLISYNPSSKASTTVKTFTHNNKTFFETSLYEPQGVYIRKDIKNSLSFYEYEEGKVEQLSSYSDAKFRASYPTYIISPSGKKSFWFEERNGKNVIFIGDKYGKNAKQVMESSNFKPYGWYGGDDKYILLSKDGSELYIAQQDMLGKSGYTPVKISDYHKPSIGYQNYGYGYGGL